MPESAGDAAKPVKLTFRPVGAATRDDFIEVFDGRGGPRHCWCMVWRATKEELKDNSGPSRRKQMLGRIDARTPVGLVAYAEGEPVAWVSIAPKGTFRGLGGPETEAGEKIWSLTCMYMRSRFRGTGAGHQLIAAAISRAKRAGATILEAYPVAPDSPSYRFMGFIPAFKTAGFKEIERAGTRRHVMRLTLTRRRSAKS